MGERVERFWLATAAAGAILALIGLVVLLVSGTAVSGWTYALLSYFVLNTLLWWLYVRRKRRQRNLEGADPDEGRG